MPIEEVVVIVTGIIALAIGLVYWLFAGPEARHSAVHCQQCRGANDTADPECRYCQHFLPN